jgi:hypothetical protein
MSLLRLHLKDHIRRAALFCCKECALCLSDQCSLLGKKGILSEENGLQSRALFINEKDRESLPYILVETLCVNDK